MKAQPAKIPEPRTTTRISEDWLAVCTGLLLFLLAFGTFFGADLLGWAVTTSVWTTPAKAIGSASKAFAKLPGALCLALTFVFLLVLMTAGARLLGASVRRFAAAFTAVFAISYLSWIVGSWAPIAATPDKVKALHIGWSLNLTSEAGYIVALVVGLVIGNFFPRGASLLKEAIRPELYVKTAIVILGGFLGATAAEQLGLASSVMFRGLCAIVEAYLIYWALVYFIARKYFHFSREWAVPLASGISICGVSAAIATGSAIKARPIVPIMVSSLVVIFAVVELLVLPFVAQHFLYTEPMVAGGWMGLAVKTDGAAVAAGTIAESLILAKATAAQGIHYRPNWIIGVTTTVKVFIDIFICVWACLLAWIWSAKIEPSSGQGPPKGADLVEIPQVHPRLRGHFRGRARHRPPAAPPGRQGQGRDGRGKRVPRYLLRDDVLQHRRCVQLPQALGGRHRAAGARLRAMPVRIHHLDRADNLLDFLPRRQAAGDVRFPMSEERIADELKKMDAAYEPLLPIEKRLIAWSLGIGVALIGILVALSRLFDK